MGYFRRYKLTDYTAEECRDKMNHSMTISASAKSRKLTTKCAEEWACFRELLARHEQENQSPSDEKRQRSD